MLLYVQQREDILKVCLRVQSSGLARTLGVYYVNEDTSKIMSVFVLPCSSDVKGVL